MTNHHLITPQSLCRASVAQIDITPPVGIYHRMWGAAVHDRATGVHRPLLATLLYLRDEASDAAQLIIAVDHCIIDGAEMAHLRAAVGKATSLDPGQVHINLSHTHGS